MKDAIAEKIRALFRAEFARMAARGATGADMQEEAYAQMIAQNVARRSWGVFLQMSEEDRLEVWRDFIQNASANELRDLAAKLRAQHSHDAADAA